MPKSGFDHLIHAITTLTRRDRLFVLAEDRVTGANADSVTPGVILAPVRSVENGFDGPASQDLMLDVLESLAARFGAAREEISAAYGTEWQNDFLDLIAKELRMKRERIERWAKTIVATGTSSGAAGVSAWKDRVAGRSNEDQEGTVDIWGPRPDTEWWSEQFDGPLLGGMDQDSWLWENNGMGVDENWFFDGY